MRANAPNETLIVPPSAGGQRILASLALDFLSVSLLIFMMGWTILGGWTILASPVVAFLYRAAARSGGRQSFGQAVFHLLTTNETAGPADFEAALRRGILELLYIPRLLVSKTSGPEQLEKKSATLELHVA